METFGKCVYCKHWKRHFKSNEHISSWGICRKQVINQVDVIQKHFAPINYVTKDDDICNCGKFESISMEQVIKEISK